MKKAMYELAYGIGTTYGAILPYSRLHESEADKMGLIFMAMAGYDPHAAPEFWKRMQKNSGEKHHPNFYQPIRHHPTGSPTWRLWFPKP